MRFTVFGERLHLILCIRYLLGSSSILIVSRFLMKKYFSEVENDLGSRLGTKVKISEGANKGKIEIEYYSKDDLERILFELKK